MPSRWWVPIPGLDPHFVRLEHLHAAVTRWFDSSAGEHHANGKPYAVSPLRPGDAGGVGVEIGILTDHAHHCFSKATAPGSSIRLGSQTRPLGRPQLMHNDTWAELGAVSNVREWELEFVTPTTFRAGDRASPLPHLPTILTGLAQSWQLWADDDTPGPDAGSVARAAWVSDLDLRSEVLRLPIPSRDGGQVRMVTVSGCVGSLTIRISDPNLLTAAASLVRLAAYTGIGSMTRRGLGQVRVRAGRRVSGGSTHGLANALPTTDGADGATG